MNETRQKKMSATLCSHQWQQQSAMVEHPAEILKRERTSRLITVFLSRYPQFQDPGLPPPAQLQQLARNPGKIHPGTGGHDHISAEWEADKQIGKLEMRAISPQELCELQPYGSKLSPNLVASSCTAERPREHLHLTHLRFTEAPVWI